MVNAPAVARELSSSNLPFAGHQTVRSFWVGLKLDAMFASLPHPKFQSRLTARVCLVWLGCVMLLPLPVPMMHRHDCIEAPQALENHLGQLHSQSQLQCLEPDEAHWHLVLPSHRCNEDGTHDGLPIPPRDYVGSAGESGSSLVSVVEQLTSLSWVLVCADHELTLASTFSVCDPRIQIASASWQRDRCTLSCVMRC